MPDQSIPFLKEILSSITFAFVAVITFLGWGMKRQIIKYTDKVDDHDKNHINKDDFNATLSALRADIKDGFKEMKSDYREIRSRLDKGD